MIQTCTQPPLLRCCATKMVETTNSDSWRVRGEFHLCGCLEHRDNMYRFISGYSQHITARNDIFVVLLTDPGWVPLILPASFSHVEAQRRVSAPAQSTKWCISPPKMLPPPRCGQHIEQFFYPTRRPGKLFTM